METKRERIVQATLKRYRTHGICNTTLKDVSLASGVPLGNLYYYFKTREDLTLAALDVCEQELMTLLRGLEAETPERWVAGYFDWLLEDPETAVRYGCPFGALALELRAMGDRTAPRAADIVQTYQQAVLKQLGVLPSMRDPEEVFLAIQGAYTVARILDDHEAYRRSILRLRDGTLQAAFSS